MIFISVIPWGIALLIWGILALTMMGLGAVVLVIAIALIPFRIGLGLVGLALQIILLPFTMLTGRR